MKNLSYAQGLAWLREQIPHASSTAFPGEVGLARTKSLLAVLGNPQEHLRIVHVAGTSGKGSTAYLIAHLLQSHGFRVGLSVKPYIFDVRERFQINSQLPSKAQVAVALSRIRAATEHVAQQPTYFETVTVLMFLLFAESATDYVVVETGLGGTFDATNVVNRPDKLVVLTRIGHDHTHVLGTTLPQIAVQKAGIIQPGNSVIALAQRPAVNAVFSRVATQQHAKLHWVDVRQSTTVHDVTTTGIEFSYRRTDVHYRHLRLSLRGRYQSENATLAIEVLHQLAGRDAWSIDSNQVRGALQSASLPAHCDILKLGNQTVVIDGAHNPQKMRAFLDALTTLFPDQPRAFLVSFKQGKDVRSLLRLIESVATRTIVTSFETIQDMPIHAVDPKTVAAYGVRDTTSAVPDPLAALREIRAEPGIIVITGSVYFCGSIYPILERIRREGKAT